MMNIFFLPHRIHRINDLLRDKWFVLIANTIVNTSDLVFHLHTNDHSDIFDVICTLMISIIYSISLPSPHDRFKLAASLKKNIYTYILLRHAIHGLICHSCLRSKTCGGPVYTDTIGFSSPRLESTKKYPICYEYCLFPLEMRVYQVAILILYICANVDNIRI